MKHIKPLTLSAMAVALTAMPVSAATTTCNAALKIYVSPVPEETILNYRAGQFAKRENTFTLTYAVAVGSDEPVEQVVTVDLATKRASVQAAGKALEPLSFERLGKVKFSEIPLSPEGLAGLALVRDRLKTDAKFIKNDTFSGEPVQTYSFRESKSVFGKILFSTTYGVPLKVEVFDNAKHARRYVTLSKVSR